VVDLSDSDFPIRYDADPLRHRTNCESGCCGPVAGFRIMPVVARAQRTRNADKAQSCAGDELSGRALKLTRRIA